MFCTTCTSMCVLFLKDDILASKFKGVYTFSKNLKRIYGILPIKKIAKYLHIIGMQIKKYKWSQNDHTNKFKFLSTLSIFTHTWEMVLWTQSLKTDPLVS